MRIDNSPNQGVAELSRTSTARNVASHEAVENVESSDRTSDHVNVSQTGKLLNLAKAMPSPKAGKVSELKSQYQAGTYKADVSAVTRSLSILPVNPSRILPNHSR